VALLEAAGLFRRDAVTCFAQQGVNKQPATHTNLAMNSPDGEFHSAGFKRFAPREHMLVNAIHERAIEIEKESWPGYFTH
jgi:hypothetical protein